MIEKKYFHLLFAFFRREWLIRYGSKSWGLLLLLANPVAFIGLKILAGDQKFDIANFQAFLFGLMWWMLLSSTIANSAAVASSYSDLLRKAPFPRSLLISLPLLLAFVDFSIGIILFLGYSITCGFSIQVLKTSLIYLFGSAPFLFGISAILVILIFRFRKFRYAIPFLILAAFITTPFFFYSSSNGLSLAAFLNPISFAILDGLNMIQFQEATINAQYLWFTVLSGFCYLFLGILIFKINSKNLADF
jgi:ABC-type polysaccharide/polyol phosphate export permease